MFTPSLCMPFSFRVEDKRTNPFDDSQAHVRVYTEPILNNIIKPQDDLYIGNLRSKSLFHRFQLSK